MSTYFIRTTGNDGNDGLSYTTGGAWQTPAKAISTVAAGDTVYIAPGTYYESVVLATAGNSGAIIKWIGDKEAQYFLDLNPGPVRITGCDSVTGITDNSLLSVINTNGKTYNYFYSLVLDGAGSSVSRAISSGVANINVYDCVLAGGTYGFVGTSGHKEYLKLYRCYITSRNVGIQHCEAYNCVIISSGVACANSDAYNTIVVSGSYGFSTCFTLINCMAVGCNYGFGNTQTSVINCVATYCAIGFAFTTVATPQANPIKCKSINCTLAFNNIHASNVLNVSDCFYSNVTTITGGTGTVVGTPTEIAYMGYTDISKLLKLATALKFDIHNTDNWSSDLHSLTVTGITTPLIANNDYVNIGTYNSQSLYQSIYKDFLIFNSTTVKPSNWIIEATGSIIPNEVVSDYAYSSTVTGTYTNTGSWAGTTVVSTYTPIIFGENYDILNQPRRMGNGIMDCGPIEYSDIELEWNTYKTVIPAIKINKSGQKRLTVTAKANTPKTISCWTYFDLNSGSLKPQLIISSSESIVSSSIVTAIGSENTWEQLSTTVTPYASGLMTIDFYSRETGSLAYSIFSDFKI